MKPLILSFFMVILGYSLFLDKKESTEIKVDPNLNTIHFNNTDTIDKPDTIIYFADYTRLSD